MDTADAQCIGNTLRCRPEPPRWPLWRVPWSSTRSWWTSGSGGSN